MPLPFLPLISKLEELCPDVMRVWYADDATGASTCTKLRCWWDELSTHGPLFDYYPNPPKTCLVVKEEHETCVTEIFDGTGVHVTTEEKCHLGAALGSRVIKKSIRRFNRLGHIQQANNVQNHLTPELKRCVELAEEKGSSSGLSVLPLEEHGI